MLKIKGLKKKKKGKKGKHKEDDLFDPEELEQLEQYRREHQQKLESGEVTETAGEGSSNSEQSEEWKKFQALTAGVDDILKKTQGDLNRIKTTSYYQRKPPGPSTESKQESEAKSTKWTRFEDGTVVVGEEPSNKEENPVEEVKPEEEQPPPVEEVEEEEESDQDEDIFDTSYVDVVASGNVKLAYIPDSPTEDDTGPDPFDTSIVDKVIKVDPKKKHLVSLGCAVEVLTGKVDKPIPVLEALPTKRKRPKKQDLLLGSFEELDSSNETTAVKEEPLPKSILDEEPEFVPDEIDLSINLATSLPPPSPIVERKESEASNKKDNKSIVSEFDAVGKTNENIADELDDELDDEFAALAQESVLKEVTKDPITSVNNNFDESIIENEEGTDPFDTTFAANVLPGKFELKLIEEEILLKEHDFPIKSVSLPKFIEDIPSVRINDITNEHNFLEEDQAPLSFKHRDLLGGSTTDLTKISDSPIEPAAAIKDQDVSKELTYSDPFDTSVVDILVAPGKTELKFLEKELLDGIVSREDEDDDFNPRADSPPKSAKPPVRPDQLPVGEKRLSIPKVVAFNIAKLQKEADLLAVDQEDNSKVSKPLTPYYANPDEINSRPSCESDNNPVDPFDTSFVSHAPGKAELKLIETELVSDNSLKRDLSDPDFNPREGISVGQVLKSDTIKNHTNPQPLASVTIKPAHQSPEKLQPDILSEESLITAKLHTPVVPKKIEEELNKFDYTDPFDTSIVKNVLPGKAELKLIESELISADLGTSIKRSYTDPDFNPRDSPENQNNLTEEQSNFIDQPDPISIAEKPLTPQSATSNIQFDIGGDIDPFDTSCVENLVPGKTELKLLETELFN